MEVKQTMHKGYAYHTPGRTSSTVTQDDKYPTVSIPAWWYQENGGRWAWIMRKEI